MVHELSFVNESSMEDSFIYRSFNASNGLIDKIVKYIKTSVKLDRTYFEEQYFQMKKTNITPLTSKVIDAFDNGSIEILFSKETKVGVSIPFIVRKDGNNVVATIFISSFATIDKNDDLNIPVKQLYALMECAYIALQMQTQPMKIQRNVALMKLCTEAYTQMIIRILNKDYSLVMDNILYDKTVYAVSRFFIERIWEYPNKGLIDSYSSSGLQYIEELDLSLTKTSYDSADIKDINDLMNFIKTLSPRMKDLSIRYFIERFINTYHASAIMCLDYLPYVFFVIVNIMISSFLISQSALGDVIKNIKGMNKFYIELSKLI